mgnify:CR=1 FL=1
MLRALAILTSILICAALVTAAQAQDQEAGTQLKFAIGGWLSSRFGQGQELTEERLDEMVEGFWRCTACRRCNLECPLGIDHGLIARLGRYALSMAGIASKALQVSTREQLEEYDALLAAAALLAGVVRGQTSDNFYKVFPSRVHTLVKASYDPDDRVVAASQGNDDGFSGAHSFIRKEGDGLVIADLKGPGMIRHIHVTRHVPEELASRGVVLEIWFDDADERRQRE